MIINIKDYLKNNQLNENKSYNFSSIDEAERKMNETTNKKIKNFNNIIDKNELDSLMPEALKFVINFGQASISKLQRRFGIGFVRASRIVDQMEQLNYISPSNDGKPREVYITMEEYNKIYGDNND